MKYPHRYLPSAIIAAGSVNTSGLSSQNTIGGSATVLLNADRWIILVRPGARDEPGRLYLPAPNAAALGRRVGL